LPAGGGVSIETGARGGDSKLETTCGTTWKLTMPMRMLAKIQTA
jgi:hypothetical protein